MFVSEKALRKFCTALEIDYQDTMAHWVPVPVDQKDQFPGDDEPFGHSYVDATGSVGFLPLSKPHLKDPTMAAPVKACIEHGMPVYLKLKQFC